MRIERGSMARLPRIPFLVFFAFLLLAPAGRPQERPADPVQLVKALSEKCAAARDYAIEGEMVTSIFGTSKTPVRMKFSLAVSGAGKYALMLNGKTPGTYNLRKEHDAKAKTSPTVREEYWRISDGEHQWVYLPGRKEYSVLPGGDRNCPFEAESVPLPSPDPAHQLALYLGRMRAGQSIEDDADPIECAVRLLVPVLGRVYATAAQIQSEPEPAKAGKNERRWPKIVVASQERRGNNIEAAFGGSAVLTELTVDPAALSLHGMNCKWISVGLRRVETELTVDFTRFDVGNALPEAAFTFVPPSRDRRVDRVTLPGQTSSALIGDPAPDFTAGDTDGYKLRFSSLRGSPVLLAFWGWSGAAQRYCPAGEDPRGIRRSGIGCIGGRDTGQSGHQAAARRGRSQVPGLVRRHSVYLPALQNCGLAFGRPGRRRRDVVGALGRHR